MKIAFDVQGTLIGSNAGKVVKLYRWFQSKGAEMTVWSHGTFQRQALMTHKLTGDTMMKPYRSDYDEADFFDIMVDDENQIDYLPAKNQISVYDIPDDESKFEEMYGHYFKEVK